LIFMAGFGGRCQPWLTPAPKTALKIKNFCALFLKSAAVFAHVFTYRHQ
jgi:hypothetical protein